MGLGAAAAPTLFEAGRKEGIKELPFFGQEGGNME